MVRAGAGVSPAKDRRDVPECIAKREPDAAYGWFSNRRLLVSKGDAAISLSADDLRGLLRFVETNQIEVQL